MPLDSPNLGQLLGMVRTGKVQLPDFQRPWKWDDDRILSLLATVTLGYPLGVLMTLETGGPGTRFKPRPLDGTNVPAVVEPEQLLMDGQQRLTSLYQALGSGKPVDTMDARGKKLQRWYYIDIEKAIGPEADREDAILSVSTDRRLSGDPARREPTDLSTQEAECAAGIFPVRLIFDTAATQNWMWSYAGSDGTRRKNWQRFTTEVLENVTKYQIPVIKLTKETPKEAVCTVFEKVNTGGVPLNVFELLTATFAGDTAYFDAHDQDFQLPEDWRRIKRELSGRDMLSRLEDSDFLQAVCLVSTHHLRRGKPGVDPFTQPAASCKRRDILDLPLQEYLAWSPQITEALHWSARFLQRQGVFGPGDLPYRSQVPALAAIRTVLGDQADTADADAKVTRWYWCGVLGEQYSGSLDTRLARDLEQVVAWVRGGREPASVTEANFSAARLNTMNTRNSAAYKGVYALVLKQGCVDWTYSKEPINATIFDDQKVDLALIFPKAARSGNDDARDRRNSIVNKTTLTHRTRSIMGNRPPSVYLGLLEAESGLPGNWLDDILETHLIDPEHLRAGDFDAFYAARSAELLALIEDALGKRAIPAATAPESAADYQPE